jgi:hypothetical protein
MITPITLFIKVSGMYKLLTVMKFCEIWFVLAKVVGEEQNFLLPGAVFRVELTQCVE